MDTTLREYSQTQGERHPSRLGDDFEEVYCGGSGYISILPGNKRTKKHPLGFSPPKKEKAPVKKKR